MNTQWSSDQPIYRQIRDRVVELILDGQLGEGEALPSVRAAAADFQLNPLTVLKGYQELSEEGLVEKRRGLGMFVLPEARTKLLEQERERFLTEEWPKMLERMRRLELDPETLLRGGAQ